ncbi:MAG: GDP-mannose 4,6-dehydratase [Lewinellaceae bacterium]|nr:GDP-mannose 4,6-dehydratase [Saprospiraceae bacterium]MCB9317003.1 GDP-mannose 4,6-dehydratase [Lewinellaceae bacterium]MCB9330181.1 GDP-mannose 4,6-dehydratase [Lewinellaceae bacterium]
MGIKLLVTGGAGFIGSNLVEKYLNDERVELVRVVDDLSNGYYENVVEFEHHPKYEFIKGDICDYGICQQAMRGIHKVTHQAALGSVPRSLENPARTNEVNVGGTVNILHAAKEAGVDRVVLAFSSSTYGDSKELPKVEERIGRPLSPYAVSKYAAELYAEVFNRSYGLNFVGLRYFNIFGPRQNADNPYAAVIPIFCKAFIEDTQPRINGDGTTSRDFTFVENALHANDLALFTENQTALNTVYNVACGEQVSLNEMVDMLRHITGKNIQAAYGAERAGDVKHSHADISKIQTALGYTPQVRMMEGLKRVYQYNLEKYTAGVTQS